MSEFHDLMLMLSNWVVHNLHSLVPICLCDTEIIPRIHLAVKEQHVCERGKIIFRISSSKVIIHKVKVRTHFIQFLAESQTLRLELILRKHRILIRIALTSREFRAKDIVLHITCHEMRKIITYLRWIDSS
jgi:hypothetical protein